MPHEASDIATTGRRQEARPPADGDRRASLPLTVLWEVSAASPGEGAGEKELKKEKKDKKEGRKEETERICRLR